MIKKDEHIEMIYVHSFLF